MQRRPGLDASDVLVSVTTPSFDICGLEIFLPLITGASVVVADHETVTDGYRLGELLTTCGATVMQATPATWKMLLQCGWGGLPGLKMLVGGESLETELARVLLDRGASLWNLYGPTETTIWSTVCEIRGDFERISIGRPIDNTNVYVLDDRLEPVPVGVAGELLIAGAGVSCGYRNRADLTAEKFVPSPFGACGERLYRTGDLVRWLASGQLEFLGRMDHQVKVRGYRIELGEIESALLAHESVRESVVLARPDGSGENRLIAYVVLGNENVTSVESLRRFLQRRLPDYMVPSAFVVLDRFPLTLNNKIDRSALPEPDSTRPNLERDYVAPRNELEVVLAAIWRDVLNVDRVGIHDDFFDLGGHSLLALAIISQIRRRLGHEVPLRWLFEQRNVEGLAKRIQAGEAPHESEMIALANRREPLPASFGQQRFWVLQQIVPDRATYNVPMVFHLRGPVDAARLRASLRSLIERHEVLRTSLVQEDETLVQRVLTPEETACPWMEEDWSKVDSSEFDQRLQKEARLPFDLSKAPLWRVLWVTVASDDHILAVTFHHSIVDEWSLQVFVAELAAVYASGGNAESAKLTALPAQYADFASWEIRHLQGELLERRRAYWRKRLESLPPSLELPSDRPRPVTPNGRGGTHRFNLPEALTDESQSLARAVGTSLFSLMLATYFVWLHRYTGQRDLVVGTPVAQRGRAEVQSVLGYFLNTLPIRAQVEATQTFRQVLREIWQRGLDDVEHGDLPFEQMVELAGRGPHAPVFSTMFVLVEDGVEDRRLGSTDLRRVAVQTGTSKCDLILSVMADGTKWVCELEYAAELFALDRVELMAGHWLELLRSIVGNPDKPVGQLRLVPAEERRKLLVDWSGTTADYPRNKCVHELFQECAERARGAVAVVWQERCVTYEELNRRANQLAHRLRQLGVRRESPVAIHLDRSLELVITMLAVLKAGGTYVPVARDYPVDRLRFMLEDSGAVVCVTGDPPVALCPPGVTVIDLRHDATCIDACSPDNLASLDTSDGLAYIMYTSGSTGRPKGTAIPHRAIVRLVKGQRYAAFDANQRFLFLASPSFDAATFEVWGALLNGAACVIYPQDALDLPSLEKTVRKHAVTCLWLTSGLFNQIVDDHPAVLATVKHVLTGGDVLSVSHVRRALDLFPDLRLTNGYGPTECTTFTCTHEIRPTDTFPGGSVPIGRPLANTQCYVLDESREPMPVGVPGELYVGGDGLARGYLNLADLTAEKFVAHPFSLEPGARLYRTGDVARYLPDGTIEFLGRRDRQVKIRGFRIEIDEVECVLGKHPDVKACAVVAQMGAGSEKTLTAFAVLREHADVAPAALRRWLSEVLPRFSIPARFAVLDALPLTANGKVDRVSLEKLNCQNVSLSTEYTAAQSELETELAAIWAETLQVERVGVDDDFFDMGGNSLKAVQVLGRIRRRFRAVLPMGAFLENPTIRGLGALISGEINRTPDGRNASAIKEPVAPLIHVGWQIDLGDLNRSGRPYHVVPFPNSMDTDEHCRVEYLADRCTRTLREIQPHGPYLLVGACFGGILAFEMAQRLKALGEDVRMVTLIDAVPSDWRHWVGVRMIRIAGKVFRLNFRTQLFLCRWWDRVFGRDDYRTTVRVALSEAWALWRRLTSRAAKLGNRASQGEESAEPNGGMEDINGNADRYRWSICAYRPKPYAGQVLLFTSQETASRYKVPGRGWGRYASDLREHQIPSTHFVRVNNDNEVLVELLCNHLDEATNGV